MENMRPGNSFPQICVVSVNQFVEKQELTQGHVGSVNESNTDYLLNNNSPAEAIGRHFAGIRCIAFISGELILTPFARISCKPGLRTTSRFNVGRIDGSLQLSAWYSCRDAASVTAAPPLNSGESAAMKKQH
jgi:hypothetical protein